MKAKRIIAGLLSVLTILPFTSCEQNGSVSDTAADSTAKPAVTSAPEEATDAWGREIVPDSIPEDLTFNGETVRIFTRNDNKYWLLEITAEEGTGDILNDSVYNRNMTVEERLGITFEIKQMPGTWGPHEEWFNVLRGAVMADDNSIDAASVYISQGVPLITEGMFLNLLSVDTMDLEKPWWNQSFSEEMTMYEQLYSVVGDLTLSMTSMTVITYYNKDLLREIYPEENLYQIVRDGKWTLDYLKELSSSVYSDLNGNGTKDADDRFGYLTQRVTTPGDAWPIAMGIYATTKNDKGIPELSFYTERTVNAYEKLESLYTAAGSFEGEINFAEGNLLFCNQMFALADELRGMEQEYGILPMPKYDEAQQNYATIPQNGHSMITITKTADKPETVGAALELLAAESYRQVTPVYFESTMKAKYLRSNDDALMFDLIMNGVTFNFGYVWSSTKLNVIAGLMRNPSRDLTSTYKSREGSYKTGLANLLSDLEQLGKNQ